jgi:SAM-dependent methyltransferase
MSTVSLPTESEIRKVFDAKYRSGPRLGKAPALRLHWRYFTPDDHYEALLAGLVNEQTRWLDVGCGRDIFPSNRALAEALSKRCSLLVGVDPDATILENPFLHEKIQGTVADLDGRRRFDLVTMRMVAEHVTDPGALLSALRGSMAPGGLLVVYTINRWSPVPIVTKLTPFSWHHPIKRVLWKTEEKDTFPVAYKMNTRPELDALMRQGGFREEGFWYLDDCRSFQRFEPLHKLELGLRYALHRVGLRYPENCLLGVYRYIGGMDAGT